jgi:hypothetical protein
MWLPPAAERPDAVIDAEVTQVSADVVEYGDGVRVADGNEGRVVEFVGVHAGGHGYRLVFDNGAEIRLILPESKVEFVDSFELTGGPEDEPAPHAGHGRTYAEYAVTPPLMARVRAFLSRKPI